jgi:hypothetical protein
MVSLSTLSFGFELQPLSTRNFSPATIGFGLPALGAARTVQPGVWQAQITVDLVSNSAENITTDENLFFDGETYRGALSVDYGVGAELEIGIELPLLSHRGGRLDSFIEGWHDTFGLPQGIRDQTSRNQLDYSYSRLGGQGFSLQSDTTGIGDLSLRGAWQYWRNDEKNQALALRVSLKLPTGSAEKLTGSGSTDLAIWLSGEERLQTDAGQLFLYGGGGGLISSDGDLLSDQRNNLVGFVTLGCGWQPWSSLGLQLQFDGNSPFYQKSRLRELSGYSGQISIGGSLSLAEQTVLELAVVEDIIVGTAPDVVFHFALRQQF